MSPDASYPRILPVGEAAVTVEFGDRVDVALNRQVHALDARLRADPVAGIVETVPTYRSLLVIYDPQQIGAGALETALAREAQRVQAARPAAEGWNSAEIHTAVQDATSPIVEIPVRYGGETGPDLGDVATHCGLTEAEVVEQHTAPLYQVAMLGFAPGFAYLLGLPTSLTTPRLATPRLRIPAGSVGIAGWQTGLYALSTPGGWRIIGRTDLVLFDPERSPPFTLDAGVRVRFVSV